jgi:outer membrane protein assembly factor BamB
VKVGAISLVLLVHAAAARGQWDQFGGPERNFHCPAGSLAPAWPEKGPPVDWRREVGEGYSGILVDGERLYTMARRDGAEFVLGLDRATGATVWEHSYKVDITPSAKEFGGGPASTPALAGHRLITIGVGMHLFCLNKTSGKVLWRRSLMDEFQLPMPGRGYSSSPIVYRNTVILPIGGVDKVNAEDDEPSNGVKDGAVMAFDLTTGETAWSRHNFPESKASPILIEFASRQQLVVFTGNELAGLDPGNGALLWRHEHPTSYGFNCATPVFDGVDTLVCSSAYNNWTEAVQLADHEGKIDASQRWSSRRLRVHFTNLLLVGENVYGSSGMGRPAFVACLDVATGSTKWMERGFARANLLHADGRFVILDEDGLLALARFTDEGSEITGRLQISDGYAFSAPTLVGTRLYVRDRKYLTVFDLGSEAVARHESRKDETCRFSLEIPALPDDIETRLGHYRTDSPGREPSRVQLLVQDGWLKLDMPRQQRVRLAPMGDGKRWEVVEDRTSGSIPRRIELLPGKDGEPCGFLLWSPSQAERTYRMRTE